MRLIYFARAAHATKLPYGEVNNFLGEANNFLSMGEV
jgi:hypothetical protein